MRMVKVKLIKKDNEHYAEFYADMWNKEHLISLPLKTNNPTLLENRINKIETKGYWIFSQPIYHHLFHQELL